jgi:murein DD-endopeptidase MepM/ murein hydrolase activator NlpD
LQNKHRFISIIEGLKKSDFIPIDLSVDNKELSDIDFSDPQICEKYIYDFLANNNGKVAYGGYFETRNLYNHNTIFNNEQKPRNIHLGIDFWTPEKTEIITPFDGIVHSFTNNRNAGDYGPTIILAHHNNNNIFYSLYGHLCESSIATLKQGNTFKKGEVLAKIGGNNINGGYAPHLHFQIINDPLDYIGDYPGVASIEDLDFFKINCPNPLHYLGFAEK